MGGTAAQHVEEVVADFLQAQRQFDFLGVVGGHGDGAVITEKIRQLEQVDVEGVALDPFPAIE